MPGDAVGSALVEIDACEAAVVGGKVVVGVGAVVVAGAAVDGAAEDGEAVVEGEYEVVGDDVDAAITPELTPEDAI